MSKDSFREFLQSWFERQRYMTLNQLQMKDENGNVKFYSFATIADELKNPESHISKQLLEGSDVLDNLMKAAENWK